jgi:hypothetical protein
MCSPSSLKVLTMFLYDVPLNVYQVLKVCSPLSPHQAIGVIPKNTTLYPISFAQNLILLLQGLGHICKKPNRNII